MGFLTWIVVFAAVWMLTARILKRPTERPKRVAKRAFEGARVVGNTFFGSAGGQALPDVEPEADIRLEPGGEHVERLPSPPEPGGDQAAPSTRRSG
ncbi:hypothetical protein L6R49_30510 [Myxococcota bacterium]|nr:hypothetical protein [Myxococcota bacterium]